MTVPCGSFVIIKSNIVIYSDEMSHLDNKYKLTILYILISVFFDFIRNG